MAISRFKTSTLAQGLPKFQDLWDGTSAVFESDYELIERVTVGSGGSSSITFSSIPSTYKHLQIRLTGRIDRSGEASDFFTLRFNSDTASNYSWHALEGSGTTTYAEAGANSSLPRNGDITATTASASIFGVGVVDILEYKNTNINKTVRSFTGRDQNGSGWVWLGSSLWRNTAAISTINILPTIGTGFQQYSSFALYGIKGAS
jgi:hypothetical protein